MLDRLCYIDTSLTDDKSGMSQIVSKRNRVSKIFRAGIELDPIKTLLFSIEDTIES